MIALRNLFLAMLLTGSFALAPACQPAAASRGSDPFPPFLDGNFTLSGNDTWTITDDSTIDGNIVLADNASLVVSGASLTINGTLWARNNASAIFLNSTVVVDLPFPPPLSPNVVYESPNGFFLVGKGCRMDISGCRMTFNREFKLIDLPDGTMIAAESIVSFGSLNITDSRIVTPLTVHLLTSSRTYVKGSEVNNFGLEVDAFIDLQQCSINGINILDDRGGPSFMSNCKVDNVVAISRETRFLMEFCSVQYLNIDGNATVSAFRCTIFVADASENARLELDRSAVLASDFPFPSARGSATVVFANASTAAFFQMRDNARVGLAGSLIDRLEGLTDSACSLTMGSSIGNRTLHGNATVYQNSSLTVRASLNGNPVDVGFIAQNARDRLSLAGRTGPLGTADVWLAERCWESGGAFESGEYNVTVRYRSWNETQRVSLPAGEAVSFDFVDRVPPALSGQTALADLQDGKEALTVTVIARDEGFGVTNVTLMYSVEGSEWRGVPMSPIGGERYAGTFQLASKFGERDAEFHVVAFDGAGNRAESGHGTYVTGRYDLLYLAVPVGLAVVAAVLGGWTCLRRKRRMDRYLGKRASSPPADGEVGNDAGD